MNTSFIIVIAAVVIVALVISWIVSAKCADRALARNLARRL